MSEFFAMAKPHGRAYPKDLFRGTHGCFIAREQCRQCRAKSCTARKIACFRIKAVERLLSRLNAYNPAVNYYENTQVNIMTALIIINDAPYGTEKAYNAMRIANQLGKDDVDVRIFLMADAATCALAGQDTPDGYYNIERMLKLSVAKGAEIKICGTCASARGIRNAEFVKGAEIGSMAELSEWVIESDRVLTF